MKKKNPADMVYIIFFFSIFTLALFLYYLFSGDNGYKYVNTSLNIITILFLFAMFVLLPMVYIKANKASGGRLTPSRLIKEIFKLDRNTREIEYNEKDAQEYVYSRLDINLKNKFADWEINKILEYISYYFNEKNIKEDQLYSSVKKNFQTLTESELSIIKKLESGYQNEIMLK